MDQRSGPGGGDPTILILLCVESTESSTSVLGKQYPSEWKGFSLDYERKRRGIQETHIDPPPARFHRCKNCINCKHLRRSRSGSYALWKIEIVIVGPILLGIRAESLRAFERLYIKSRSQWVTGIQNKCNNYYRCLRKIPGYTFKSPFQCDRVLTFLFQRQQYRRLETWRAVIIITIFRSSYHCRQGWKQSPSLRINYNINRVIVGLHSILNGTGSKVASDLLLVSVGRRGHP